MAALLTPSLRSAMERLKHAGSVNGLLLGWRRQLLLNLLPFEDFRAQRLLASVQDAHDHFSSNGDRSVKTFWFGYDVCHILVCSKGETTLVILHTRADEVDFLRRAGETFLEDTQFLFDSVLNPSAPTANEGEETQRLFDEEDEDATQNSGRTNFIGRVMA